MSSLRVEGFRQYDDEHDRVLAYEVDGDLVLDLAKRDAGADPAAESVVLIRLDIDGSDTTRVSVCAAQLDAEPEVLTRALAAVEQIHAALTAMMRGAS